MQFRSLLLVPLAAALAASAHGVNIVLNPGFETGSFTNWTATPTTSNVLTTDPHSGTYEATFSPLAGVAGASALSQTLTTIPNTLYNVSFYLENSGTAAGSFTATLGGSQIFNFPTGVGGYQLYSTTYTALTASSALVFTFTTPAGALLRLDDVTVEAAPVPEPAPMVALALGAGAFLRRRKRS